MILNGYLEVINHLQQLPLALILIFNLKIMKQIIFVILEDFYNHFISKQF